MKKYTDTELLEKLLPMLHYTLITNNFSGTVDFKISENICRYVDKDFIAALEDKIIKLADEMPIKAEDNVADKNIGHNDNYKEEQKMELNDIIKLMKSADYKDRFKAEYYQVKIRHDKLGTMLKKYDKNELDFKPKCSYALLLNQYRIMSVYLNLLKLRADIEEIRLEN